MYIGWGNIHSRGEKELQHYYFNGQPPQISHCSLYEYFNEVYIFFLAVILLTFVPYLVSAGTAVGSCRLALRTPPLPTLCTTVDGEG